MSYITLQISENRDISHHRNTVYLKRTFSEITLVEKINSDYSSYWIFCEHLLVSAPVSYEYQQCRRECSGWLYKKHYQCIYFISIQSNYFKSLCEWFWWNNMCVYVLSNLPITNLLCKLYLSDTYVSSWKRYISTSTTI